MRTNDYGIHGALTIACLMTFAVVSIAETSQAPFTEEATAIAFVTKENSPRFVEDCEAIDNLPCRVHTPRGGSVWMIPQRAKSAHALLRRLLAEYPLHRGCRFHSRYLSMTEEDSIAFLPPAADENPTFILQRFAGGYVELSYGPTGASEDSSIGATFHLSRSAEGEYYWVLANCLAEKSPEIAKEYRRKAAAIRNPIFVAYVLSSVILGAVVLIAMLSLWRSLREPKPAASDDSGAEADPAPPSDGPTT